MRRGRSPTAALKHKRGAAQVVERQNRATIMTGHCRGPTATTAVTLQDRRQGLEFASAFGALRKLLDLQLSRPGREWTQSRPFGLEVPLIVCLLEEGRTDDF
jgi:hypothetical protein